MPCLPHTLRRQVRAQCTHPSSPQRGTPATTGSTRSAASTASLMYCTCVSRGMSCCESVVTSTPEFQRMKQCPTRSRLPRYVLNLTARSVVTLHASKTTTCRPTSTSVTSGNRCGHLSPESKCNSPHASTASVSVRVPGIDVQISITCQDLCKRHRQLR